MCILHGAQPVGNHQGSPSLHQVIESFLHEPLTCRVQCASGLQTERVFKVNPMYKYNVLVANETGHAINMCCSFNCKFII